MNPSMYNDRNVLNGGQPRQENPSLSAQTQVWQARLESSTDHYPHQDQNSVPFYNPANAAPSTPYFCPQPSQLPTDAWPPWSNEQNNNNNNPTIFQPQNHTLNPVVDPWQWSVPEPSVSDANQWSNQPRQHLTNEVAQPSYEQYQTQMIPEQGYYYGQQAPSQQWDYAEQPLDYEANSAESSWNAGSWNPSCEPEWNPILEDPNLNQSVTEEPSILDPAAPTVAQNLSNQDLKEIPMFDIQHNASIERVSPEIILQPKLPNIEESLPPLVDIPQNYINQVDEPNQEVPEPVKLETSSLSSSPSHNSSVKLESTIPDEISDHQDPPNEQTPCKSDSSVTAVSSEKVVIKPWEGGPFQPPLNRQNSNEIVQQELPETAESLTANLATLDLNKSANLETEPDNMERPPDPNLNRVNPHHIALHKAHFGEEQDSEASNKTNLWEQPNLPNVLLLPASVTDNLSRSGSPASFNLVPPTIPVVIPSKEDFISPTNESSPILTEVSKNVAKPVEVNSPLNLVELDRSPRRRPEFANKPQSKSYLREGNSRSQSPLVQALTEDNRLGSLERIKKDNITASREYDPRFREVEAVDSHYGNRNQYKNDRYYYDERNSRPSSRASEPIRNHYPSRYSEHGREFDNNGGPSRPSREGTPSRIMSEDDLRRDCRSNEYRDLRDTRDFRGSNKSLRDDRDSRNIRDLHVDPTSVRDPHVLDPRAARDPRVLDTRTARDPSALYPRTVGEPRDLGPISARDPRDLAPISARDPRDLAPISARDPRDLAPISARDPRDLAPISARDPRDLAPISARDPRDLAPISVRNPRDLAPISVRDPCDLAPISVRDPRDLAPISVRDPRDLAPITVRDPRVDQMSRDLDPRSVRDPRDLDPRSARDARDLDPRSARDARDPDLRNSRDTRRLDTSNSRDSRVLDMRNSRDPRDYSDPRSARNPTDPRDKRDYRDPRDGDYDRRSREREDYTDSRRYEEDRRQPYTRGGEDDYYNRSRGYKGSNGGYAGYDYYQQPDRYSMYYNYYNYPLNYNYGYYDELYRTNPKYREQVDNYRAYYSQMGYDSDRMSSHSRSGRSSVNEDISKDSSRFQKDYDTSSEYSGYQASLTMDNSYNQLDSRVESASPPISARLTPAKFSSPHIIGTLVPGKLLITTPFVSSVTDTSLQIHDLQQMLISDNTIEDLRLFPGPLLSGQTHKNDVIQFCQHKITILQRNIDIPDRDSRILLWELLILMLRQNGNVSGSDIAELLLKDLRVAKTTNSEPSLMRQASAAGSSSSPSEDASELPTLLTTSNDGFLIANDSTTPSPDEGIVVSQDSRLSSELINNNCMASRKELLNVDQITRKFTEYLLFGHKKDALEWASKHGLWGHALFLASKMDPRSYANIMTRFANSLPLNDPLQTLYQLMSGRQPYSVTRLADEKFGDWRVHLAMILSNLSPQPEVDCRSITTLGDTLAHRGCLSAAHFCYLMAQVEFGRYDQKSSKMVLLTASHTLPFDEFTSNEAIQCTEIYEYAQSLANPNFVLTNLQPYKLIYASRLAEYGFLQESLHYCEIMASLAQKSRTSFSTSLLLGLSEIAWKLKYYDPLYTQGQGELEEIADPEWFTILLSMSKEVIPLQKLNTSITSDEQDTTLAPAYTEPESSWANISTVSDQSGQYKQQQSFISQPPNNEWNQNQSLYAPQQTYLGSYGQSEIQESMPIIGNIPETTDSMEQKTQHQTNTFNGESSTITSPPKSSFDYYGSAPAQFQPTVPARERQDSFGSVGYDRRGSAFSNSSGGGSALNTSNINSNLSSGSKPTPSKENYNAGLKNDQKGKPQTAGGSSWFGKILGNFLPKGPNQMILPDDKNPSIVWDAKNSRWVNTYDDDSNAADAAPVAPPKDSELKSPSFPPLSLNNSVNASASPPPNASIGVNRFQKPKFKSMRQNYVDILNTNNSNSSPGSNSQIHTSSPPLPVENIFQNLDPPAQIPTFFIPASVPSNDGPRDFVSQGHIPVLNEGPNENESTPIFGNSTPMFDPAEFSTAPKVVGDFGQKRSAGGYNMASRRAYPS